MFKKFLKRMFRTANDEKEKFKDDKPEKTEKTEHIKLKKKEKEQKDPNMQVCPCCGKLRHINEFAITGTEGKHKTRERICNSCLIPIRAYNKKDMIQRLKTKCVFTGNTDKIVRDFHHQFGKKEFTLSNRKKSTVGTVLSEAIKCIICDSNTHRLIHEYHKDGEDFEAKIVFKRDYISSYMLEYYVNFINECYVYIKMLYGNYKKNFEFYVPDSTLTVKNQIKEARLHLQLLVSAILIREKYLGF